MFDPEAPETSSEREIETFNNPMKIRRIMKDRDEGLQHYDANRSELLGEGLASKNTKRPILRGHQNYLKVSSVHFSMGT